MTTFKKIYDIVSTIPKGKVMTYQQVASRAGIVNPRIVGFALNANKDFSHVPCHRVIGNDGSLKGYALGVEKKKQLLQKEGIPFITADLVDLSKALIQ